jgi:hypothetical protein
MMTRLRTVILVVLVVAGLGMPLNRASAQTYYLHYFDFTATTCSATGFFTSATARYDLATDVTVRGSMKLDGEPFPSPYFFPLPAGSGTYPTWFGAAFSPALSNDTYEFEFVLRVTVGGETLYRVVVTANCNNGVLTMKSEGGVAGPEPGCDAVLDIPSTAVGGQFVTHAEVYWTPGELTNPLVVIPLGNTARVLGTDASGQYYQIIWACDFVWVRTNTIGPNFDNVWQGRPLPAGVIGGGQP